MQQQKFEASVSNYFVIASCIVRGVSVMCADDTDVGYIAASSNSTHAKA